MTSAIPIKTVETFCCAKMNAAQTQICFKPLPANEANGYMKDVFLARIKRKYDIIRGLIISAAPTTDRLRAAS